MMPVFWCLASGENKGQEYAGRKFTCEGTGDNDTVSDA